MTAFILRPEVGLLALRLIVVALALVAGLGRAASATLDGVRARNQLVCGVSDDVPGLAMFEAPDSWDGIEVEFCRAVAAAVLGDGARVRLRPVTSADGFRALAAGEIDLLAGGSPWNFSRDTELKARFVDVLLYDGQGFMLPRNHGLASVLELSGASICVVAGTSAAEVAAGYFSRQQMRYQLVTLERWGDVVAAYASGSCTAITADLTQLAAARSAFDNPNDHVLLPEIIDKVPLGPAVRVGDDQWFAVVRWVLMALIAAEELEITRDNADQRLKSSRDEVRRLLGVGTDLGAPLGLGADWGYRVIKQTGNYGEIFERWLGLGSSLKLPRGYNRLWSQGGLMYAVPIR